MEKKYINHPDFAELNDENWQQLRDSQNDFLYLGDTWIEETEFDEDDEDDWDDEDWWDDEDEEE